MAKAAEVLEMLIPNGGWIITGDEYEGIQFVDCEPITKKEFEDGFKKYDLWLKNEKEKAALAKTALLDKLGITEEEAKLLLS